MKIVHLSSVHYALDTRIFHRECSSLIKLGYQVDLVAQWGGNETLNGVNIVALPQVTSKSDRLHKVIPSLWKIATTYPKKTLFHIHDSELIIVGLLLKRKGYKVIYDVHEDVPRDLLSKVWIPVLLRKPLAAIVSLLEARADKYFDAIISVTEEIKDRFQNTNNYLVRNYPDANELLVQEGATTEYHKRNNVLTYIGEIQAERGIHHIIEALSIISDKYPDITFDLGGKINERYKSKLEELKGWQSTNFLGWVSRPMIPTVLNKAKIGLLVLDRHPNFENSKPVKLFEYMLSGLPIIASDFNYWKNLIGEANCAIFIEPSNPAKLVDALEWILNNPKAAKEMGERGRNFAMQKFNWSTELDNLQLCYKEALKNG